MKIESGASRAFEPYQRELLGRPGARYSAVFVFWLENVTILTLSGAFFALNASKWGLFHAKCLKMAPFSRQMRQNTYLFRQNGVKMVSIAAQNTEMAEYRAPGRPRKSRRHRSKALDAPDSIFKVPRSNFEFLKSLFFRTPHSYPHGERGVLE